MPGKTKNGWEWLEKIGFAPLDDNPEAELTRSFARCFAGEDGKKVLQHLRAITFDRCFGPETEEGILRYAEGQRALVAHIEMLCKRAR